MAAKLKQIGLKQLKCDFNYQSIEPEIIERQRHDNSEHKIMLKILDRLSNKDENQNIKSENIFEELANDLSLDMSGDVVNQVSKNERLIRTLIDIVSENNATKKEYKVTEINLTGDLLANEVESYLANSRIIPTDVEYQVLVRSLDIVSEDMITKAKLLETNELPHLQPSDLIIVSDSPQLWHINSDTLAERLNEAIIENGFLIIVVKYKYTEPEEAINSVINANKIITNSMVENRLHTLVKTFLKSGLRLIASKSDSVSTMTIMFRKVSEKQSIPEKSEIIEVKAERYQKWFEAIRESLQKSKDALDAGQKPKNVWLIANDTHINGIVGLINCLRLEPGGQSLRCLFDMDSSIKLPIDWSSKPYFDILTNDLVINVIKEGKLGTYRHLKLPKDNDKIVSNQYYLNQGANKDLSSLTWFDLKNFIPSDKPHDWVGNKIQLTPVNIYSSGLIFKDIMFATGI